MIPIALGVTLLVFFLIHLVPGDPARTMLGTRATPERVALLHEEWGLDEPLPTQYWRFLTRLVHGDLGSSLFYSVPAGRLVVERLPVTLWLIGLGTLLSVVIAIPLATIAAARRDRADSDHVVRAVPLVGLGFRRSGSGSCCCSRAYVTDPGCLDNRLFRTGEWGRMSSDGCLEHLGRRDSQVMIRGYRVETYETELALLHHPAVDHAIVLPWENNGSDKYLVGYITANTSRTPTVRELRSFLKDKIPEYMIPAAFVFLESFPITANGKVDFNALPDPSTARSAPDNPLVSPRSPIEQGVAAIWSEILGVNEIGVEDNHFELGGNSLTVMQVAARVEKQFRVSLSLKQFFESPTIRGLSRAILVALGAASPTDYVEIGSAPRDQILPLSFAQQRLWFLEQWEPDTPVYNICRAYRLVGPVDVEAMRQSGNALVERHEVLRTCFPASEGQPRQSIADALKLAVPLIDLRDMTERERIDKGLQLVNEEGKRPFNLAEGPMLRMKLIRLMDNDHILIFTVHQIICDGWSMQVLRREFWAIYEVLTKSIAASMPVPTLQYVDFALWQRQWLRNSVLDSQISYWKNRLSERLPILNLPTDYCRPIRQSFRGSRQSIVLSQSLTQELRDLARREEVTFFILLMAAFQTLLHRYVQEDDLIVGFPIANRNWTETAGLVGPFVNTLVLRADFSGEPRFREVLPRVREACLGAYAHQDLPFEKLIEELRLTRDLSRNPLFQVMFVLQIARIPWWEFKTS